MGKQLPMLSQLVVKQEDGTDTVTPQLYVEMGVVQSI